MYHEAPLRFARSGASWYILTKLFHGKTTYFWHLETILPRCFGRARRCDWPDALADGLFFVENRQRNSLKLFLLKNLKPFFYLKINFL
jgi:hypothetical protein